jgi:hypothetical protein
MYVQVYVAFVGGPTMFLNLPRTTFGDLQVIFLLNNDANYNIYKKNYSSSSYNRYTEQFQHD